MRALVVLVGLGGATLAAGASVAHASPRVHEVEATPIYRRTVVYGAPGARQFSTNNLRSYAPLSCNAPDTIMVVTSPSGTSVMNDDCTGSTKTSCVNLYGPPGEWTVTVFAKETEIVANTAGAQLMAAPALSPQPLVRKHCGVANVSAGGSSLDQNIIFGGEILEPALAGQFRIDAVAAAAGSDDPVLLAFNGQWKPLGYSNDDGPGRGASLVVTLTTSSRLLVGSFSLATAGRVVTLLNDCITRPDLDDRAVCRDAGKDTDGDYLSNALETELATSPTSHDTDRDGLFDYYEAIGRLSGGEQELRRFGANPRRRDVFLELDREINEDGELADLFDEATIDLTFEDPYLDLPRMPPAPDGSRLIALHVDSGVPCPNRPTLCGDWGGSEDVQITYLDLLSSGALEDHFAEARRGLFHYGYNTTGGDGRGGRGQTIFYANGAFNTVHELGHNLGLQHWGAPGQVRINSKPNYPSLINYLFGGSVPVISPDRPRFSEGRMPAMDGPLDESVWAATGDARYLGARHFEFALSGTAIDLNRDFRINYPGVSSVMTDVAPIDVGLTGDDPWPNAVDAAQLDVAVAPSVGCANDCLPTGGGALAVHALGGDAYWTLAFLPHLHTNGWTYPDYTQTFDAGDPGGWWQMRSLPAFDGSPMGEASAEAYTRDGVQKVLLLFPHRTGRLYYLAIDLGQPELGAWQPLPGWPAGAVARSASLERVGDEIVVVWRDGTRGDSAPNVFSTTFDVASESFGPNALDTIASRFTPGLSLGPDGQLYMAFIERVVSPTHDGGLLRVRRRGAAGGAWQQLTPEAGWELPAPPAEAARQRLAVEWVPLRTGGGAFPDGSAQLWVSWVRVDPDEIDDKDRWQVYRAVLDGYVSPTASDLGAWRRRFDKPGERPYPHHSVATAMQGVDMSALFSSTDWEAGGALVGSRFLPYHAGVAPGYVGIRDNDDAAIMSATLCSSVWYLIDGDEAGCRCDSGAPCGQGRAHLPLGEEVTSCDEL